MIGGCICLSLALRMWLICCMFVLLEVVSCPLLWSHRKKSDFDDDGVSPFDEVNLNPFIADALQIAVSASM